MSPQSVPRAVTGIILCGGGGRRFQGHDKPLELLAGRPLVAHVIDRVAPQVDTLIVSANRNRSRYEKLGYPVVADRIEDRGPLAGIEAVLESVATEWLFVCPGDTPLLPLNLVDRLREAYRDDAAVAVPHDGERAQQLFMFLRTAEAGTISPYLKGGGRSVAGWLADRAVVECPLDSAAAFTNVNTRSELESLATRWHSVGE